MDPRSQHLVGGSGPWIGGTQEMEAGQGVASDFTVEDANELCKLVQRNESLICKKRRYLLSLFQGQDGSIKRSKRPKFMKEAYLAESEVRGDELSCERVKACVERCFGLERNGDSHHVVQDGVQLFNLQKEEDGSLSPGGLKFLHRTISKLSLEALHSVAIIVTHNRFNFEKTGPRMKNIVKDHLPAYLVHLDNEKSNSQLSQILTNPSSYLSDCISFATPVKPRLLSSVNQALDELVALPKQALLAMNRKLKGISQPPRFDQEDQAFKKQRIFYKVKKKCNKIISKLVEGRDLPRNLAKAMSVVNLCRKKEVRCMDISLSEFFPFSKQVISLQNEILNALWSLENMRHRKLKLLQPILLRSDDKKKRKGFKTDVRHYLLDCLFECDEGNLPDKALQVIAFFDRMSQYQAMLTEERKEVEVDTVLNLSSYLRAVGCYDAVGDPIYDQIINLRSACTNDAQLTNLDSDDQSEDNDFVFTKTNYFNFGPQQNLDESCSSNSLRNAADSSGHSRDTEVAGSMREPFFSKDVGSSSMERTRCSIDNPEICDETAMFAHKIIGHIMDSILLSENKEVDERTRAYLQGGSIPQGPQEDNQSPNIVINAIKSVMPNISTSCIEQVRSILNVDEQ